jgi:LPS sulfotransferase NodH
VDQGIIARLFLVGCPRSGTTLLHSFLAAHPDIACFPESHFFENLMPRKWMRAFGLPSRRAKACLRALCANTGTAPDATGFRAPLIFASRYARCFLRILDEATTQSGKRIWVEKTPGHVHHIDDIERLIPGARFIHLIRDGRNVVASLYEVSRRFPQAWNGPYSLEACIRLWNAAIRATRRHADKSNHAVVRYEELVRDPEPVVRALCRAVGIEYVPAMLADRASAARSIVPASEPWNADVLEDVIERPGKFEIALTAAEKEIVLARIENADDLAAPRP